MNQKGRLQNLTVAATTSRFSSLPHPYHTEGWLTGTHGVGVLHCLLEEHEQGEVKVKQPKRSLNFLSMGP